MELDSDRKTQIAIMIWPNEETPVGETGVSYADDRVWGETRLAVLSDQHARHGVKFRTIG